MKNLSTKNMRENTQLACFSRYTGLFPMKANSYEDDNVRVNHSDRRLIFADMSASFSRKEVAFDTRTETSCFSASKLR